MFFVGEGRLPYDFYGWFVIIFTLLLFASAAGLSVAVVTGTLPDSGGSTYYDPESSGDIIRDRK